MHRQIRFNPSRLEFGRKKKKKGLNLYFHTSLWYFFVKPFEVPQKSVKIKIYFFLIQLSEIDWAGRVNTFGV